MFRMRDIFFVMALFSGVSMVTAAENSCVAEVKALYNAIVELQSGIMYDKDILLGGPGSDLLPAPGTDTTYKNVFNELDSIRPLLKDIFLDATTNRTGMIKQYDKLISDSKSSAIMEVLLKPRSLVLIARMQRLYGEGEPFALNKSVGGYEKQAFIAEYKSPAAPNKVVDMTFYGVLNSIIDRLNQPDAKARALCNELLSSLKIAFLGAARVYLEQRGTIFALYVRKFELRSMKTKHFLAIMKCLKDLHQAEEILVSDRQ